MNARSLPMVLLTLLAAPALGAEAWTPVDQPDLAQRLAQAGRLEAEDLGAPVKSVRKGALMWVPNPDGKTYDLLQWYFRDYGGPTHVFIMDLATGELKQDGIALRRQIHICGRVLGPNGKLYLATPEWKTGMELHVYDPATNELSHRGLIVPGLTGERREMTVGTDGMIYGTGSYFSESKAGAYQIDPATDRVTIYGPIGPSHKPNSVWGYSIAADDRCVYVASGKIPWYLVAYDRVTGKDSVLLTTEKVGGIISVKQRPRGCTARASKVLGTDGQRGEYWLYQGKAILKKDPKEAPPWDATRPLVQRPMPPKPQVSTVRATPKSDGSAEIWWRPHRAARQDVVITERIESLDWQAIRFTVPTYPMAIYRLTELPDSRIFGTAGSYEGNFIYDPASAKTVHLGKIHLSHYATAMAGGKVYMCGYPSSPLYVYDPTRPWTANEGVPGQRPPRETDEASNPRMVTRLNKVAGTHKMYAATLGADGCVYFGGRWYRNGNGGGFAWWDPSAQAAQGTWEVFSNYQISAITAAAGGRYIVISTIAVRDAILGKPTPEQGKLFVFDTTQHRIVREIEPVAKAKAAGFVASAGADRVLGWTAHPTDPKASILYGAHAATGQVAFRKTLPCALPVRMGSNQRESFDYRVGPHGRVWTYMQRVLVRIDPTTARVEAVGKIGGAGRLAFSGDDVYAARGTQLLRLPALAKK